ncbi:uncharacterized protein LOC125645832 isoform X1 [Ostrea edulis]|uniref:uncharacterized protein LOC125645832 isoform X1 n=1 Tax=Ostrea edulis TaxID=37623 RepID=UPI002094FB35|nr:uncharacterized protein LOC125645832 isoform X1 [Ostrea edulis]
MSKSYSVTDWALHDGNDTGTDHEGFWAERLQDEDDPDMESEQKAAYENRSAATGEEPDLKPAEDEQSESRMFAAVDERMEKQEEQMEEIELPAVIHAKSPSPLPEDIGNPVGCVKRTLGIIDSLS